jgi:predicted small secreted protein
MKTFRILIFGLVLAPAFLSSCQNPSEKGQKVKSKMTSTDTVAKKPDTLQAAERLNPEDTVKKY